MSDYVTGTLRNLAFHTVGAEDIEVQVAREDFDRAVSADEPTTITVRIQDPKRYADRAGIDYKFLVLNGTEFHVTTRRSAAGQTLQLTIEAEQRP